MEVKCQACSTEYILDETLVGSTGTTVRCSNCGEVFKVFRKTVSAADVEDQWLLRQDGNATYPFARLSTLRKWILQHKVVENDLLARAGGPWKRLGDIPELRSSFEEASRGAQPVKEEGARDSRLSKIPLVVESGTNQTMTHGHDNGASAPSTTNPSQAPAEGGPDKPPMAKPFASPQIEQVHATEPNLPAVQNVPKHTPTAPGPLIHPEAQQHPNNGPDHTLPRGIEVLAAELAPSPSQAPAPVPPSVNDGPPVKQTIPQGPPVQAPVQVQAQAPAGTPAQVVMTPLQPVVIQPVIQAAVIPATSNPAVAPKPDFHADFSGTGGPARDDSWQTGQIAQSEEPAWAEKGKIASYRENGSAPLPTPKKKYMRWILLFVALGLIGVGLHVYLYRMDWATGIVSDIMSTPGADRHEKYYLLGKESFLLDNDLSFREADREYQKVLGLIDNEPRTLAALAELFAVWAQYQRDASLDAESDALRMAKDTGKDPDLSEAERFNEEFKQKLKEAKRWAAQAEIHAPKLPFTHRALAEVNRLEGEVANARLHLGQARSRDKDFETEYVEALLLIEEGAPLETVLRSLESTIQSAQLIRASYRKARVLAHLERYDEAQEAIDHLLSLNGDHDRSLDLAKRIKARQTVVLTRSAIPIEEEAPPVAAPTAEPPTKTVPAVRRAAPAPTGVDGMLLRARQFQESNRTNEALELYQQALESSPSNVDALIGVAYCYLDKKSFGRAISHFRRVLNINASHGPGLMGLANTYKAQGQQEQALKYFQKYLDSNPSGRHSSMAKRNIAQIEESLAEIQKSDDDDAAPNPGAPTEPAPAEPAAVEAAPSEVVLPGEE